MKEESELHWADEKEALVSDRPVKLLLGLFKCFPGWLVRTLIYPVSFFYLIFSARARNESYIYQRQLKQYTNGECPPKIRAYRQILAFSLCLAEKIQGWLGQIPFNRIEYQDDDIGILLEELKQGHGAVLITSHLGNMELMRSLSEYNRQLVNRDVPIVVIMELQVTEHFTRTLHQVNPKASFNVIDTSDIGPDTICFLIEQIEQGALIVIAGDRTSAHSRDKIIRQNFLGKLAPFPYGSFLLPFLMKAQVYYMFGLRSKTSIFNPKYRVYIEKSKINFECARIERENNIKECCAEFSEKLEKFCKMYPYQWYNFYNYWNL